MEAPLPQASRELAGRHCHSMGGGAYYCVDPCVCGDMACHGRIVASGNRLHRGRSHRSSPELRRADGRAGRSRVPTGRDAPGGGGSDPTGAAAPGGAGSRNGRDRRRAGDDEALLLAGPSPETGRAYTQQEFELRERLRLEALERRSRSLRSSPVAQTYRQLDRARSAAADGAEPGPVEAIRAEAAAALSQALGTFQGVTGSLEDDIAAEADADRAFLAALTGAQRGGGPDPAQAVPPGPAAGAAPAPNSLGFPGTAAQPARDYANPPRLEGGDDPPGWERIYEGAFLEAVLVTQLSGDFPGPVLAQVAVPFYSADRQRVLVPRGARVIGTASAVQGQDQERLAVSFHRLIYPDGRWVTLDFHGLNQVGEGALKDRVNRHYFSMFAAVGAVGIISGLTLQNSNPYGGGAQAFRAGAGQGLGQAAEQILQRFLNRLPNITIRAGHRLRIWFTSDVLVPRNLKGE